MSPFRLRAVDPPSRNLILVRNGPDYWCLDRRKAEVRGSTQIDEWRCQTLYYLPSQAVWVLHTESLWPYPDDEDGTPVNGDEPARVLTDGQALGWLWKCSPVWHDDSWPDWLRRLAEARDLASRRETAGPAADGELTAPAPPLGNMEGSGAAPPGGVPAVVLRGRGEGPTVRGRQKPPLTGAQYDAVKALVDAGECGLSKDELDRKSKHGDARKTLKRLADSDPDWKAVLRFPGKPGRGYRIG